MRAIWTGAIGFGLVNIPVRIFSATQDSNLDLDMLDKKDHAKIRFKRVNEDSGREVSWENIVKAYDYNGKYIVLDDEDFQKASPEKSKIIEIVEFVKESEFGRALRKWLFKTFWGIVVFILGAFVTIITVTGNSVKIYEHFYPASSSAQQPVPQCWCAAPCQSPGQTPSQTAE